MPKYRLPTDERMWVQPNKGDAFGNLWHTFNLDFDSAPGRVRVSPLLRISTDSNDDADFNSVPVAFLRTSASSTDQWWAVAGGVLFKTAGTDPTATMAQDAIANSPTNLVDAIEFAGNLIAFKTTDISRLVAGTWTASWWQTTLGQGALTGGGPREVTKKTNLLLIGDDTKVHAVDKNSNVSNSRLILPADLRVVWIRSNYDGTWIGTRNVNGGEAPVLFWDESAENYNRPYNTNSSITFAGAIDDRGIPFVVNGRGQLLEFTGTGFEEVSVFPVFDQPTKAWRNANADSQPTNVHRNGMAFIDGHVHILLSSKINNSSPTSIANIVENFPSGIWTYDKKQGLRHKYSIPLYDGTEIDYGQFFLNSTGALVPTNESQGVFLAGVAPASAANLNNSLPAIMYRNTDDSLNKRGHFISSIFPASAFEDVFQDLLARFRRNLNASDKIILKYRTIKNVNYPIAGLGTWSDTDTFTSAETTLANAAAGDEVFITYGRGGGGLFKISSISEAGGTYTINLSETMGNASGNIGFVIVDWKEAATISTQSIERYSFDLDAVGTWLQLKAELRSAPGGTARKGATPELEEITITSIPEASI